jgi:hypothetical protein
MAPAHGLIVRYQKDLFPNAENHALGYLSSQGKCLIVEEESEPGKWFAVAYVETDKKPGTVARWFNRAGFIDRAYSCKVARGNLEFDVLPKVCKDYRKVILNTLQVDVDAMKDRWVHRLEFEQGTCKGQWATRGSSTSAPAASQCQKIKSEISEQLAAWFNLNVKVDGNQEITDDIKVLVVQKAVELNDGRLPNSELPPMVRALFVNKRQRDQESVKEVLAALNINV